MHATRMIPMLTLAGALSGCLGMDSAGLPAEGTPDQAATSGRADAPTFDADGHAAPAAEVDPELARFGLFVSRERDKYECAVEAEFPAPDTNAALAEQLEVSEAELPATLVRLSALPTQLEPAEYAMAVERMGQLPSRATHQRAVELLMALDDVVDELGDQHRIYHRELVGTALIEAVARTSAFSPDAHAVSIEALSDFIASERSPLVRADAERVLAQLRPSGPAGTIPSVVPDSSPLERGL